LSDAECLIELNRFPLRRSPEDLASRKGLCLNADVSTGYNNSSRISTTEFRYRESDILENRRQAQRQQ
jgi:hypothetical protein